jgi:hypothetical protein
MTKQFCPKKEILNFRDTLSAHRQVTLVGMTDFGYAYTTPVTIKDVTLCSYAQYDSAIKVTFREKRKRKDSYAYFYSSYHHAKMPAVVLGHPDLKSGMQFNEPEASSASGVSISQAKYFSTDSRNVTDILDAVPDRVIFRPAKF